MLTPPPVSRMVVYFCDLFQSSRKACRARKKPKKDFLRIHQVSIPALVGAKIERFAILLYQHGFPFWYVCVTVGVFNHEVINFVMLVDDRPHTSLYAIPENTFYGLQDKVANCYEYEQLNHYSTTISWSGSSIPSSRVFTGFFNVGCMARGSISHIGLSTKRLLCILGCGISSLSDLKTRLS